MLEKGENVTAQNRTDVSKEFEARKRFTIWCVIGLYLCIGATLIAFPTLRKSVFDLIKADFMDYKRNSGILSIIAMLAPGFAVFFAFFRCPACNSMVSLKNPNFCRKCDAILKRGLQIKIATTERRTDQVSAMNWDERAKEHQQALAKAYPRWLFLVIALPVVISLLLMFGMTQVFDRIEWVSPYGYATALSLPLIIIFGFL